MHSTHASAWLASSPTPSLIGDQSQGKATQCRTSKPSSLLNLNLNLLVSPDRPPSLGKDPRNFTLAHSPFLATVDPPSLAAGADSANDPLPAEPASSQILPEVPKAEGFFPKLHSFPHNLALKTPSSRPENHRKNKILGNLSRTASTRDGSQTLTASRTAISREPARRER
jgi:hypothetical protein